MPKSLYPRLSSLSLSLYIYIHTYIHTYLFIPGIGNIHCQSDRQAAVACSDINANIFTVTVKYFFEEVVQELSFLLCNMYVQYVVIGPSGLQQESGNARVGRQARL